YDVRRWLPPVLGRLGLSTSALLNDANLSIKPANWSPANPEMLDAVRGGDLERRDLRHALGFNAFGVNSYLMEADLPWADLPEAGRLPARPIARGQLPLRPTPRGGLPQGRPDPGPAQRCRCRGGAL